MTISELEPQSLARSCHEVLILAALRDGPRHGYQLALEIESRSRGAFRFNHGTLYPILHRLERSGLIAGSWSEDGGGRRRKSYALTRKGTAHTRELLSAWEGLLLAFRAVVGGGAP